MLHTGASKKTCDNLSKPLLPQSHHNSEVLFFEVVIATITEESERPRWHALTKGSSIAGASAWVISAVFVLAQVNPAAILLSGNITGHR